MGKLTAQQKFKRLAKKCHFCGEDDYNLLDAHRIVPGPEGGKYTESNVAVTCASCHRKCHSGRIQILGRYFCSNGQHVFHYLEDGEEKFA